MTDRPSRKQLLAVVKAANDYVYAQNRHGYNDAPDDEFDDRCDDARERLCARLYRVNERLDRDSAVDNQR